MEQKQVRCPQCKTVQPLGPRCAKCGLDFREYARKLREKKAAEEGAEKPPRKVRCPRCKEVQPLGPRCTKCGLDFREYARKLREKRAAEEGREAPAEAEAPAGEKRGGEEEKQAEIKIPVLPREPELESIGDLLGTTWLIYKGRFGVLVSLYVLSVLLMIVPPAVITAIGGIIAASVPFAGGAVFGASMLGSLVGLLASLWAFGGFIAASCDETVKFKEALGSGWKRLWSLLWLYLIAGYVVTGGFFLFAVPGVAMLVWFFASQFILFEENQKGMDAMLKSRAYVKGFGWGVFGRLIIISVLALFASLVPVVGSILFTPFMMLYMVHIYKDLRGIKGTGVEYPGGSGAKAKWIAVGTVGYLFPLAAAFLMFGAAALTVLQGVDVSSLRELRGVEAPVEEAMVATAKQVYAPGEPVVVEFSGLPGNEKDWITVVEAAAPQSAYGETFYTGGKTAGRHSFGALPPGKYEARVFFDWPVGGYMVKARHAFTVAGARPGSDIKPELDLDKISFFPGEPIKVHFRAPSTFDTSAWVGIVPSSVGHGSEAENDRHDIARAFLGGRTSGDLVFSAPSAPGIYDLRMNDSDRNGREAASATFAVERRPRGEPPP